MMMKAIVEDEKTSNTSFSTTDSNADVLRLATMTAAVTPATPPVAASEAEAAPALAPAPSAETTKTIAMTELFQRSMTIIVAVIVLFQVILMIIIMWCQRRASSTAPSNHQRREVLSSFLRSTQPFLLLFMFILATTIATSSSLMFLYINHFTCVWREPILYFSITAMCNILSTKLWRSIVLMSPVLKSSNNNNTRSSSSPRNRRMKPSCCRWNSSNNGIQERFVNFMFRLSDGWECLYNCLLHKSGKESKIDLTSSTTSVLDIMGSSRHGNVRSISTTSLHGIRSSSTTTNLPSSSFLKQQKQQKSFKSIRRTIPLHKMLVLIGILQFPQFVLQLCNVAVPSLRQKQIILQEEISSVSSSLMEIHTCGAMNNTTTLAVSRSASIGLTILSFLLMVCFAWWSSELPRMFNEWNAIRSSSQVFGIVAIINGPTLCCFTSTSSTTTAPMTTSPNAKAFAQIALIFGAVLPLLWCYVGQRVTGKLTNDIRTITRASSWLNVLFKCCNHNKKEAERKSKNNKLKMRKHNEDNTTTNNSTISSSVIGVLKPITSQERVAHLALNIGSVYEDVGSTQIHRVKLFQEALDMYKFDPYHHDTSTNHNDHQQHHANRAARGDIEEGIIPDGNANSTTVATSTNHNNILRQKHQVIPRRHRTEAAALGTARSRDAQHIQLIGGFTEMEVNSFTSRDLQYILALTVAKAKIFATHRGYDTKGQNSAARTWMDALDLYECCPEGPFLQDKTIMFSIFSGLFIYLRTGVIYDPNNLFESELIDNFVNDSRLLGDPIHYGRALAMKAAFVVRIDEKYLEALTMVDEVMNDVYVLEEHTVGLTKSYGSDRCAQIIAQSTLWQMELGLEEDALARCQYVIQDILPKMDLKNVFNSTTLLLPLLRVMKYSATRTDNGNSHSKIARATSPSSSHLRNLEHLQHLFQRYIMKPYREYILEKGGATIWQSIYKPLEMLFRVQTSYYHALESKSSSACDDAAVLDDNDDAVISNTGGIVKDDFTSSSADDKTSPNKMTRTISLFNDNSTLHNNNNDNNHKMIKSHSDTVSTIMTTRKSRSFSEPNLHQLSQPPMSPSAPLTPQPANAAHQSQLQQESSQSQSALSPHVEKMRFLLEYSDWILQDDSNEHDGVWATKLELVEKATLEMGGWNPNTFICEICLYLIKLLQLLQQQRREEIGVSNLLCLINNTTINEEQHSKRKDTCHNQDIDHICHLLLQKGLTVGRTTLHKLWFGRDSDGDGDGRHDNTKNNFASIGHTCSSSNDKHGGHADSKLNNADHCSNTSDDEKQQQNDENDHHCLQTPKFPIPYKVHKQILDELEQIVL